jgi:hypothetical protein
VLNVVYQPIALRHRQRHRFLREHRFGQAGNLSVNLFRCQLRELCQIHAVDQRLVQPRLHLLKRVLVDYVAVAAAVNRFFNESFS